MSKPYLTRVTRLTIAPCGDPIYAESATHVEVEDEAAGEYICVRQSYDKAVSNEIYLDGENWPAIRDAIETLMKETK